MASLLTSHMKDLDGISAAALLVRYFSVHKPRPFFLALKDYPDGAGIIDERVMHSSGDELYISDLATDQESIDVVISRLRVVKEQGNKITWMDHHPTTHEITSKLEKVVDVLDLRPSTTTGSEIVYDRLYRMNQIADAHAELLSNLGHDSDLLEGRFSVTPKLSTLIDYYNYLDSESAFRPNLIGLALHLAAPRVEAQPEALLEQYHLSQIASYETILGSERGNVLSSVEVMHAGSLTFAIFYYPKVFSGSAICVDVLEANNVSGCVGFSDDGSGSVRRKDDRVNCREIARMLGGGGHEFAAGFNLGFGAQTPGDRARARSLITEKVRQLYGP